MKTDLAIHDLSCHAAGSLSVVLPVLSAGGVLASFLPSAILSSQSDGFDNLYSRSLEAECRQIMKRWKGYGLVFDSLYSGYLASEDQLDLVLAARRDFLKPDSLILTDPVLGDNGSLYQALTKAHVDMMKTLIKGSAIITPNYTEAFLLAGEEPSDEETTVKRAEDLAKELNSLSGAAVVMTSVPLCGGTLANLVCDGKEVRSFVYENLGISYPGSGDLFASLLLSYILGGDDLFVAVHRATRIASESVRLTKKDGRERRDGVNVSHALKLMVQEVL